LLLNIALHGMEQALGVRYNSRGDVLGRRALVRYADDFVIFCTTQEDARRVRDELLPPWLAERGLCLAEEKTRIVHLSEGFDFLGCTVRHYHTPQTTRTGFKLLIRPSKKAMTRKRQELRQLWLGFKGQSIVVVLGTLNPIIRGWAGYYRTVVSKRAFAQMDAWMFHRAVRYVKSTHPEKPWWWLKERYWGKTNKGRQDRWVFGYKHDNYYLQKFAWTKIERHSVVHGTASPDDPKLREYWWSRRRINLRRLSDSDARLAESQDWCCPVCGMHLMNGEELHRHHKVPREQGGADAASNRELVHLYCHQQRHAKLRKDKARVGEEPVG